MTILEVIGEAIDRPDEMSRFAPRVVTVKVPVDKIGEVIGPKGKMINSITEQTRCRHLHRRRRHDLRRRVDGESAEAAIGMINAIANPQLPKIGERFLGTVVKTAAFGAFVSLVPARTVSSTSPSWATASASPRWRTSPRSATRSASRSPTSTTAARSA